MHFKNTLVQTYRTVWPEQEKILHEQLYACEDKLKIIQFKNHIEKYSHKDRLRYITLTPAFYYFPGSTIVYYSAEFKRLVSVVDQCLNRLEKKEEMKYQDLVQQMFNAIFSSPYEGIIFLIFFILIRSVGGTKQDDHIPFIHPKYPSIDMKDFSGKSMTCRTKYEGASAGKICDIEGTTYYMKKIVSPRKNQNNNQIMGAYNHHFLRENSGINASPETAFFCMKKKKDSCYFSSKAVEGFLEAITLCKNNRGIWCKFDPETIREKIGENSIAELAVANTFIKDLHAKNWGYRTTIETPDQNRLVILDTDQAPERQLRKHIEFVHKQFSKRKFSIALSLSDVLQMKNIYLAMQKKPVLAFHESVDMPQKLYDALLTIFIEACDKTMMVDTSEDSPSCADCNSNFARYVYEIGMNYQEDCFERTNSL